MRGIRIIARTPNGEKAMKQAIRETAKAGRAAKTMFALLGWAVHVTSTQPYTVEMTMIHRHLQNIIQYASVSSETYRSLKQNGATRSDVRTEEIQ